jgi:hypothetical protein
MVAHSPTLNSISTLETQSIQKQIYARLGSFFGFDGLEVLNCQSETHPVYLEGEEELEEDDFLEQCRKD